MQTLCRILGKTMLVLRNRIELFAVEAKEEKLRQMELLFLVGSALLLTMLALGVLTAVVIFVFDAQYRLYVASGLAVLYLLGVVVLLFRVKAQLQTQPFSESLDQFKKDVECLSSPK